LGFGIKFGLTEHSSVEDGEKKRKRVKNENWFWWLEACCRKKRERRGKRGRGDGPYIIIEREMWWLPSIDPQPDPARRIGQQQQYFVPITKSWPHNQGPWGTCRLPVEMLLSRSQ
jgi:hypothetical protein